MRSPGKPKSPPPTDTSMAIVNQNQSLSVKEVVPPPEVETRKNEREDFVSSFIFSVSIPTMNLTKLTPWFILFGLILLSGSAWLVFSSCEQREEDDTVGFKPKMLFVFGDSYADTGNLPLNLSPSWKPPYGITFPKKPAGRFSDGRVSTDFLAEHLGLQTPKTYRERNFARSDGLNFAFGGAGVFETIFKVPTAGKQIDLFQQLVMQKVYSPADLSTSVAYLSIVGNDYVTYDKLNGSAKGRPELTRRIVAQILIQAKRINDLGVKKVFVSLSPPLECFPSAATPQGCNTKDASTTLHNSLLLQGLKKLNDEKNGRTFLMLDIYSAFASIVINKGVSGVSRFPEPLKACCAGTTPDSSCGDVDKNGEKLYTVCSDPNSSFFWDDVHITEQGWRSVFSFLFPKSQF